MAFLFLGHLRREMGTLGAAACVRYKCCIKMVLLNKGDNIFMKLENLNATAEQLWQQFHEDIPGFNVEVYPSIGSTNTALFQRARQGETSPTLLVAMEQTAGRGRLGKTWVNTSGDCLMFSLGLQMSTPHWGWLALVAGISAAQALQSFDLQEGQENPPIGIKWPNDLWLRNNHHKLGGILIETVPIANNPGARYVIIGMGINMRAPKIMPENTPTDSSQNHHFPVPTPAAALQSVDARWTSSQALARIIPVLFKNLQILLNEGPAHLMPHFEKLDVLKGRILRLHGENAPTALLEALGIDELGQLQLRNIQTQEKINLNSTQWSLRLA